MYKFKTTVTYISNWLLFSLKLGLFLFETTAFGLQRDSILTVISYKVLLCNLIYFYLR